MSIRTTIDISGLNKAEILAALFNNSQPIGMGFLQAAMQGNHDMTTAEAQQLIDGDAVADNDFGQYGRSKDNKTYFFDYVRGRPLKINLEGDEFYPAGYDRDNGGDGTAERIINSLR